MSVAAREIEGEGLIAGLLTASRVFATEWLAAAAVAAVAAVAWSVVAVFGATPWVFPDELLYSEVAKSLAAGHMPAVRGETALDYGFLYPLLIAPAWAAFDDPERAYLAAKLINALVMASAALPAYFLARRFTSHRKALVVAVFSVLVPSMTYVQTLLTEVALYPAFLLSLLAVIAALERPSARNQFFVLGSIALAFAVKTQAAVLVGAYVLSILLLAALERGNARELLGRYRVTWFAVGAAVAAAAGVGLAVSGDPLALLGAYATAAGHVDPVRTVVWMAGNFAALDLYMAVIPLATTAAVVLRGMADGDRTRRIYAVVTLSTVGLMLLVVGAFGSSPVSGAEGFFASTPLRERNLFVVAPLFLIGLALFLDDRNRRGPLFSGLCLVAVGAVALYPWGSAPTGAGPQNLAVVPWRLFQIEGVWRASLVALWGAALVLLLLRVPWNRSGRLWVAVAACFAFAGLLSALVFASSADKTVRWGRSAAPAWIDEAVPAGASVAVLWREPAGDFAAPTHSQRIVWVNEFFNRSVDRVYSIGARMPYDLPDERVRVVDGLVVREDGRPLKAEFVLARCRLGVEGTIVAADRGVRAAVYRTGGTVRIEPGVGAC